MPRIRYLKPEFFTDEDLAELPFQTRLFFEGLWCHADKEGRLEYRPRYLKAMIFPYDDVDVEKEIEILAKAKGSGKSFIRLYYTPEGLPLIQIVNWAKHQRPHHTEKDSVLPAPPDSSAFQSNFIGNKNEWIPRNENLFFGDVPMELIDLAGKLHAGTDAQEWQDYVKKEIEVLGYKVKKEVDCPIDETEMGRIDLLAEKNGLQIAVELDYRTPRSKSIKKVKHFPYGMVLLRDPEFKRRKEPKEEKGMEKGMEKGSLHKASARLKNGELTVKEPLLLEDFEIFWKNYPPRNGRKAEKKQALVEWKKLHPDKNLQSRILLSLQKQVSHYQDCKKHDEFCSEFPDAHRWIKNRRWEDEVKLKTWQERMKEIPE